MSPTFALLVPVKALDRAKTRLEPAGSRRPLMRAFALDALAAAAASPLVSRVHVVTDEDGLEEHAVRLPDEGRGDLNEALRRAAQAVRDADPGVGVAAMCADLPALRTDDLTRALAARASGRWYVADAAGTGTTLLVAAPGSDLDPHFGVGSAAAHASSGAVPVPDSLASLRADVDTDVDLAAARALGLGPHTRAADVPAPCR